MSQERQADSDASRDASQASPNPARSVAEWTTFGISLAVLIGVAFLVTYLYFDGDHRPPAIAVDARLPELRSDDGGYYLPVDVVNTGDVTAVDVVIQAELDMGTGTPFTTEFTVTFLAGGERVRGTLIFADDPAQGQLEVHAVSYKER
jgi:uncharacterized protein (TIGR02588 family)